MAREKSVVIIGAGMAGLSAGVYASLNGYRTTVAEMHDQPGGLVTSWEHHGYLIDGCIEFLNGSNPVSRWHQLWRELGAAQNREFIEHDELVRIRDASGRELVLYADLDQLEQHLLQLSPQDASVIRELIRAARAMAAFDPPLDIYPLAMLGELPRQIKWQNTFTAYNPLTITGFSERFKDPFLREAFPKIAPPDTPMGAVLSLLAFQSNRNLGMPAGGSLAFAQAVAKRFTDLGGSLLYKARVDQILVEVLPGGQVDRAAGIHLADGRSLKADWVISAADGRTALFQLLDGQYLDNTLRERYTRLALNPPSVQVSLGVRRDLSSVPHSQIDLLRQPLYLAGREQTFLWHRHFAADPTMAPTGRTVILCRMRAEYDYWQALGHESSRYETEKLDVAQAVIDHLELRYPGISQEVELIDVTTPLTYERYTGNYHGTFRSYILNPETIMLSADGMEPGVPGLAGFYQIGQWIQPGGGVFPAARSGREIIRKICKLDGKRFTGGSRA